MPGPVQHIDDTYAGRAFLVKVNANIGNSAVSSSIEEVQRLYTFVLPGSVLWTMKTDCYLMSKCLVPPIFSSIKSKLL
jgi:hypothetical protein